MNLISSAADAFNNPNSPYYYLVGALFLVLIFGALALYLVLVNRKKRRDAQNSTEAPVDKTTEHQSDTDNDKGTDGEKHETVTDEPPQELNANSQIHDDIPDEHAEKIESTVPDPAEQEQKTKTQEEKFEQSDAEDDKTLTAADQNEADTRQEPIETAIKDEHTQAVKPSKPKEKLLNTESEEAAPVAKSAEKAVAKSTANKKTAPKKTVKPFIDRLIATESAHNIYNSLKNIILSYPGIKAKLSKDGEKFIFGDRELSEIVLDTEKIGLYLYIDPKDVPKPLTVEKGKDGLPSLLCVEETQVDAAQRVIVYAMNVALLTRNERHRYVDYVKKAVEAKNRAKKK